MSTGYAKWSDTKATAHAVGPRNQTERAVGKTAARERREACVRGHQLAEVCKAAVLTQAEVAEPLGVPQARVSKIEHGESPRVSWRLQLLGPASVGGWV